MDPIATWAKLPALPGYEVSTAGEVRSVPRTGKGRWGTLDRPGVVLKAQVCRSTGYAKVRICGRSWAVHRLVAQAFLLPCTGECVNHKNGDKTDNRAENLEWATYSQNNTHAYRELGRPNPMTGKVGSRHHRSMAVEGVDPATGRVLVSFESQLLAVAEGFCNKSISRCIKGKIRTHQGLVWRQANA